MNSKILYPPMYDWAKDLFPINRSLTGPGVRETLAYLQKLLPALEIHAVPSGTAAFDWEVPKEWSVREAYIECPSGRRIVDFKECNLHLMGYSTPFEGWLTREELDQHLFSLPEMPDAIPYVTSYYKPRWGFCLTHNTRESLNSERYFVKIDSELKQGVLNYAELRIPGRESGEILLSTYVCHPSMANNELSGPVVTAALAQWISSLPNRRYTYRIVFIPETIGSIVYISRHLIELKDKTVAGFVVTCVGDDRAYSFLPSPRGTTLADRAARAAFRELQIPFVTYSFLDRGSDERQYCSPGVDLPVASIMRTKYGEYPEYHTSLDNLDLISQSGLEGALRVYMRAISILEANRIYKPAVLCEPQLGKRGLYPTISTKSSSDQVRTMMNLLAFTDGRSDLLTISERIGASMEDCAELASTLSSNNVILPATNEDEPA